MLDFYIVFCVLFSFRLSSLVQSSHLLIHSFTIRKKAALMLDYLLYVVSLFADYFVDSLLLNKYW